MWGALSDERTGLSFDRLSSNKFLVSMYNLHFTSYYMYVYTTYIRHLPVQAQYSTPRPIISSSCYNSSLFTSTVVWLTADKFKPLIFPVSRLALSNVANLPTVTSHSYLLGSSINRIKTSFLWFFHFLYCSVLTHWCGNVFNYRCLEMYQ
jgi:hypothetical protein